MSGPGLRAGIVGLLLLALGLAIGFLLGRADPSGPAREDAPPGETPHGEGPGPAVATGSDSRASGVAPIPPAPPGTPAAAGPAASAPAGTSVVEGTVAFGHRSPLLETLDLEIRLTRPDGTGARGFTHGPDFAFRIEAVPEGACTAEAALFCGAVLGSAETTVRPGTNRVTIPARIPTAEEAVILRVLAPDGTAVPPGEVGIGVGYDGGAGTAFQGPAVPRSDGCWVVPRVRSPAAGDREFVTVRWPGHGSLEVPLDRARNGELVVKFEMPTTVEVRLGGTPPASPRLGVVLVPRGTMRLWEPFYETWFDGGAKRFEEIAPGEYDLVVVTARQSAATELEELSRRPVTVAPGENRFDVPVPEVEGFTLRADALFAEVYPAEMADLRNRRLSVMLEGGTARCQGLPAGSWRVVPYRGEDDPLGEMIVRVPVAGDVAFVAAPRLEAVVEEVDPGSEAERLGLKPGDVIDSVDGERPRSGFDWSRSLYGLRRADSLKVGVRRAGGGSATLDAPGRLFGPRASSGARIVLRQP